MESERSRRKLPRMVQRPSPEEFAVKEEIAASTPVVEAPWILKLVPCRGVDKRGNDDEEHERSRGYLDYSGQPGKTEIFKMVEHARVRVGRAQDCEMALDSKLFPKILSKQHATIVFMRSQHTTTALEDDYSKADFAKKLVPVLVDMGSTNGTLMNGRKVRKKKPVLLEHGAVLVFGGKKSDLAYRVEIIRKPRRSTGRSPVKRKRKRKKKKKMKLGRPCRD